MERARPDSSTTTDGQPSPADRLAVPTRYNAGPAQYYERYHQMCDWIQRCVDCKRLVTLETIHQSGACPFCGSHKVQEPRTLSLWEYVKIKIGLLRFPHSDEFLAAFRPGGARAQ